MTFANNDTFNRYTLGTSPNIIIEQSVKQAWDDTKDHNSLLSFIHMLSGKQKFGPKKAKRLHLVVRNAVVGFRKCVLFLFHFS